MPEVQRPFVDRPVVDHAAAERLAHDAAAHWGLGAPVLLRSGMNAIFRAGDAVLRISAPSAPAAVSIHLAEALLERGLSVTRPVRPDAVERAGLSATAWEYIAPVAAPIDWRAVGAMVRRTHALALSDIPEGYPMPRPVDFPWWDFPRLLADVADVLDTGARRGIDKAIARWPEWAQSEGAVVCHGDVHPGNVIMADRGPVLIDWDLLCLAPPGWDHAPLMTWATRWGGDASCFTGFVDGYGRSLVGDPAAEAFAELRLVAATLMRLKAGLRDASAMPEAQRRLAFWRGDSDAPMWQAQ